MPRENRKRGKKHKKTPENPAQIVPEEQLTPSWIVPNRGHVAQELDLHAPFGYIDADVKAYFRTVDIQIRDWQENPIYEADDVSPNEERRLFFMAALTEMSGKEKQLATDPECSHILERMTHSMDDFIRRVFVDSLAGSYEILVKHRFASHVCQTIFTVASETISRESRGIFPSIPASSEHGELRTMTQFIFDICEELRPTFTSLILDPFASHVLRVLLIVLCPSLAPPPTQKHSPAARSKKSAAWAARQGQIKPFLSDPDLPQPSGATVTPEGFSRVAVDFVQLVRNASGENEVRALAVDKVASPVLQILLEIEADQGQSDKPKSLMDSVLVGIITHTHSTSDVPPSGSDYVTTLFRDPTSSHLLETLVSRAPDAAFEVLWSLYFVGNVSRLAAHPVANFVLAKAVRRCQPAQLAAVCAEVQGVAAKTVKSHRTGVLRAIIDRAVDLVSCETEVTKMILEAFGLDTGEDRKMLVPCALHLVSFQEHRSLQSLLGGPEVVDAGHKPHRKTTQNHEGESTEPTTQGAILLQSLLQLPPPHNQIVVDSIQSLSIEALLQMAHNPTSSRVLDAILDLPTISRKDKRALVMAFLGHFPQLADDRIGSRIADRCWTFADPYLREKIARSLIPYEQFLAGSYYGKYFARNLNLYLLQRRPDEWKNLQSPLPTTTSSSALPQKQAQATQQIILATGHTSDVKKKQKRVKDAVGDQIDAVFEKALGKAVKKGKLETAGVPRVLDVRVDAGMTTDRNQGPADVMGAMLTASSQANGKGNKKRKRASRV